MEHDVWTRIWAKMTDEQLEAVLNDYLWLQTKFEQARMIRIEQIIEEAGRRGKVDLMDRARRAIRRMAAPKWGAA